MDYPVKLCWNCKHFLYATGSPGYSEYTPGEDWSIDCLKSHWDFNPHETSQEEFKTMITYAQKCADYAPEVK